MSNPSDLEILCRGVDLYAGLESQYLVWDAIEGAFTHEEALNAAKERGMHLPTPAEALLLWQLDMGFRRSVSDCRFWLESSTYPYSRDGAWYFDGSNGYVNSYSRVSTYGVRCVGRPRAQP